MNGAGGLYQARVRSERFGVAVGCTPAESPGGDSVWGGISIQHATVEEKTALSDLSCYQPAPLSEHVVSGAATGLLPGERGSVLSSFDRLGAIGADGAFSFSAPAGVVPVLGAAYTTSYLVPARLTRAPDVDSSTDPVVALDFSSAVAPSSHPVTAPAVFPPPLVSSEVSDASDKSFGRMRASSPTRYSAVPASLLLPGELIRVAATLGGPSVKRTFVTYLAEPGPVTIAEPPSFAATAEAGCSRRPTFAFEHDAGTLAVVSYELKASTSDDDRVSEVTVLMSRAWLGAPGYIEYRAPDFSKVPGWDDAVGLLPGEISWSVQRSEQTTEAHVAGRTSYTTNVFGVLSPE